MVDAAATQTQKNIDEALDMAREGYQPVEQLPAKSYGDLAVRNSKGLCTCSIVQLMQAGCRCNGA
jgi:hypothetical protein